MSTQQAQTARPQAASPFPQTSLVALDLSGVGAPRGWQREDDTEGEAFIMGRLAGLGSLADRGGVDLISLDESFHLGGKRRRDAWLDGAVAASRLARHTTTARLVTAVPLGITQPEHVAGAISSVHRATAERAGWQVAVAGVQPRPARDVDAVLAAWQAPVRRRTVPGPNATSPSRPLVVVPVHTALDLELAAARADVARLNVATLKEARAARESIHAAAREWGRRPEDIRVLADIHAVISPDERSARARWDLLSDLAATPAPHRLRAIGSAADLANLWGTWVHAGAVDGFTVIPASVPTDVVALVQDVIPELVARGLRSDRTAAAAALGSAGLATAALTPARRAARAGSSAAQAR